MEKFEFNTGCTDHEALYNEVFGLMSLDTDSEIKNNALIINNALNISSAAKDVLYQLYESDALEDGDVISKSGRDTLIELGFASKLVLKREWGYQACTYLGAWAVKIIEADKALK